MAAATNAKLANGNTGRLRVHPTPKQSSTADDDTYSTPNGGGHQQRSGGPQKAPPPRAVVPSLFDLLRPMLLLFTRHPGLVFFFLSVAFFAGVEYTLTMVSPNAPPFDLGFVLTAPLHRGLAVMPTLNSILAALNTVFVAMQAIYIFWALLFRGRCRPAVAALFMFTSRGILGYCTQLPLPHEFLGSAMDFPVANVSFFLFFSGHVAGAVIVSMDMRRENNDALANGFDLLNALQALRLLVTRGHYTIDLAVGVGAGMLFDSLAAKYENAARTAVGDYSNGAVTGNGSSKYQ